MRWESVIDRRRRMRVNEGGTGRRGGLKEADCNEGSDRESVENLCVSLNSVLFVTLHPPDTV